MTPLTHASTPRRGAQYWNRTGLACVHNLAGAFVSPGPNHCLHGLPCGWSHVAPFAVRRPSHRHRHALVSTRSRGRCHVRAGIRPERSGVDMSASGLNDQSMTEFTFSEAQRREVRGTGGSQCRPAVLRALPGLRPQGRVPSRPAPGGARTGPAAGESGHDSAPGSVCSRGRAVADAQVASRRKAQHGSSRTVFHEGSELEPGGH